MSVLSETRIEAIKSKIGESFDILNDGIERMVYADGRMVAAICVLFSGGNDSTVLTHLFAPAVDYVVHINTGIGVEQTRDFVRSTCASWNLQLLEERPPPGSTYRELVLDQGFPGPAHHWKMYQRLKERGLEAVRRQIVTNPYRERVVYLAGRRRDESNRRANVPEFDRKGSTVFISPLVNWSSADMNTYRAWKDLPRNEVSDCLHMSGECLCGAFAKAGELDEIGFFFPDVRAEIEKLEAEVAATGKFPEQRCKWGWGGSKGAKASKSGPLCSSCDSRFSPPEPPGVAACPESP